MKITNNEAENLINYYFEKAVIGIVGVLTIGSVIAICLYSIGSAILSFI